MAPRMRRRDSQQTLGPSRARDFSPYFEQRAGVFSQLSARLGDMADKAAIREGEKAGKLAGADINGALELMDDSTLRGQAYNAAAVRSYFANLESATRDSIIDIEEQYAHDPAGFDQALGEARQSVGAGVPELYRQDYLNMFDRVARPALQASARRAEQAALEQDRALVVGQIDRRSRDLERIAYNSDMDDIGNAAIAAELDNLRGLLSLHGPKEGFEFEGVVYGPDATRSGALDLTAMSRLLSSAESSTRVARYEGAISRLDSPAAQKAFAEEFAADFKAGQGEAGQLTPSEYETLMGRVNTKIRASEQERRSRISEVRASLKGVQSVIADGYDPGGAQMAGARAAAYASGDADTIAMYEQMSADLEFNRAVQMARPDELAGWIDTLRDTVSANGATPEAVHRLEVAEKRLNAMNTELARDPVGFAAKQGVIDMIPLDLGGNLTAQLNVRAMQAEQVSDYYGVPVQYFTKEERQQLTYEAEKGGPALLALAGEFQKGFGPDAAAALSEVSDDAPVFAYGASLNLVSGNGGFLADMSAGVEMRNMEGFESRLPGNKDKMKVANDVFGGSLSLLPRTYRDAIAAADAAYEARMVRAGQSIGDDGFEGSDAAKLYERSIQEAVGAQWVGGKRYGGTSRINGQMVIAPSWVRGNQLDEIIDRLDDEAWAAASYWGPPVGADGERIPASRLDNVYLQSIGAGRYWVTVTDPTTSAPQYLGAENAPDGLYVLDLNRIETRLRTDKKFKKWTLEATGAD